MECNRFVAFWQTRRNWNIHNQKLLNIQPVLKTATNFSPNKMRNRSTNQGYTHRDFEIQLQNKALLAKLTRQEKQRTPPKIEEKNYPICLGNRDKKLKHFRNYEKQNQNRDLLNKIKTVRTSYDVHKYAQDYKQKEKIMNLLCKFPVRGMKPTKTLLKLQLITDRRSESRVSAHHPKSPKNPKVPPKNHPQSPIKPKSQKITKIHKVKRVQINNKNVLIKGVQYQSFIQLQLLVDERIQDIGINMRRFLEVYGGCYEGLCGAVRYNQLTDIFYLQQ